MSLSYIDVFNGDADGICALIQWRLSDPQKNQLVTGVKRDINLLSQVQANASSRICVFDISFDSNRQDVMRLLGQGAIINYFDHHYAGQLIEHPNITLKINPAPQICTSLLVNKVVGNQWRGWAIVGAFGDNLIDSAYKLATGHYHEDELKTLQLMGQLINYNAYGESLNDLYISPSDLYKRLVMYASPLVAWDKEFELFQELKTTYDNDLYLASQIPVSTLSEKVRIYIFPNQAWTRRVLGMYANKIINQYPDQALAILIEKEQGIMISVRAPRTSPYGADKVCLQFSGGGRAAAAGINALPLVQKEDFIQAMQQVFS